jgi:hypothetical protein
MGVVMITCPTTGRAISSGIESDRQTFDSLPDTLSRSKCPLCGAEHVWWTREAWLAPDGESVVLPLPVGRQRRGRAAS